jgi:hypothetical protein
VVLAVEDEPVRESMAENIGWAAEGRPGALSSFVWNSVTGLCGAVMGGGCDELWDDALSQRLQGSSSWTELLPACLNLVEFLAKGSPETIARND